MTTDIDPRELKLTAYALGELDESERRQIESELAQDEAGRAFVEEVVLSASALQRELELELASAPDAIEDLPQAVEQRLRQVARTRRRGRLMSRRIVWLPLTLLATALVIFAAAYGGLYIIMSMRPSEPRLATIGQSLHGMTKAQVVAELGKPDEQTTLTYHVQSFGPVPNPATPLADGQTYEQWTYRHGTLYLYVWFTGRDASDTDRDTWHVVDTGTGELGRVY